MKISLEKAAPSAGHLLQRNKSKEQSINRTVKEYCVIHSIMLIVH